MRLVLVGLAVARVIDLPAKWPTLDGKEMVFLGHRGMKSQMPEHTLGSYWFAAINGADYVEPDVVLTKDRIPVCNHDLYMRDGTDVLTHPKFASRMRNFTGLLDGKPASILNQFFISDFTLAELKELRVVQKKVGVRPQYFNSLFQIPTLQVFVDEVHRAAWQLNQTVNVVPELKHSTYHQDIFGQNVLEDSVLAILRNSGYPLKKHHQPNCTANSVPIPCGKLVLQNFEFASLKYLRTQVDIETVDLVMLNDDDPYFFTRAGIRDLAKYANWYGPWKEYLYVGPIDELSARNIPYNQTSIQDWGGFLTSDEIVPFAHQLNVKVVLYTFYDSREKSYRGCSVRCEPEDARAEYRHYFHMGVDGLFVENLNEAIQYRTEFNTELRLNATKRPTPYMKTVSFG